MKLKIFGKPESKPEQIVRLKLVAQDDGIVLMAVDEAGDKVYCGNLLLIRNDGMFIRCGTINEELGFSLNTKREVKIEGFDGEYYG